MNARQDCHHETLASGPVARIDRCRHGGVLAMHLGVVSVRLDPTACESLWATLTEALEVLHRRESAQLPPHPSVTTGRSTRGVA